VSVKMSSRQVGDVTVVDATGRITLGEGASVFRDVIRDLAAKGNKKILVNLADVSYIDSSGIGEMVSSFTTVTNHGGQLKLLSLTKRVKDLLQITKLYTVFEVFEDEASAVRSFAEQPLQQPLPWPLPGQPVAAR
jgi:anti-sigma B factor antagonist